MHDYGTLRVSEDGRTLIAERNEGAATLGHRLAVVPRAFDFAQARQIATELARRWNCHEALRTACKAAARVLDPRQPEAPPATIIAAWHAINAALRKARGE